MQCTVITGENYLKCGDVVWGYVWVRCCSRKQCLVILLMRWFTVKKNSVFFSDAMMSSDGVAVWRSITMIAFFHWDASSFNKRKGCEKYVHTCLTGLNNIWMVPTQTRGSSSTHVSRAAQSRCNWKKKEMFDELVGVEIGKTKLSFWERNRER